MSATRETILAQLEAIFEARKVADGYKEVVRNRGLMANAKRPAIALIDADEVPRIIFGNARNDRYGGMRPKLLGMSPEIYILMDEQRPTNAQPDGTNNLGTQLNAKRDALVNAICTDSDLKALLGTNGGIVYNGCVTDLKSGMALSGQMRLDFEFRYFFIPT